MVRTFESILGIICDYSSQTRTLPLQLVTLNNFTKTAIQKALILGGAIGSGEVYTSYMPILSPDFFNATTFIPYAIQETGRARKIHENPKVSPGPSHKCTTMITMPEDYLHSLHLLNPATVIISLKIPQHHTGRIWMLMV